ncbi:unnamed protein product [Moneuplotes crassus]|uniref:Uncharacterized protein n=1 Tax=Euplotes crassus TaxID=5936 RepID=A0AAD1X926_EUPCR|nr:unnamed protein product [Moneuplotes crassus]
MIFLISNCVSKIPCRKVSDKIGESPILISNIFRMDNYCSRHHFKQSQIYKGYKTPIFQSLEGPIQSEKSLAKTENFNSTQRRQFRSQSSQNYLEGSIPVSVFNTQGDDEKNLDDQVRRHIHFLKSRFSANPTTSYMKGGISLKHSFSSQLKQLKRGIPKRRYNSSYKGRGLKLRKTKKLGLQNSIKKILKIKKVASIKPKRIVIRSEIKTPVQEESWRETHRNSMDSMAESSFNKNSFLLQSWKSDIDFHSRGIQIQPKEDTLQASKNQWINLECADVFPKTLDYLHKNESTRMDKVGHMNSSKPVIPSKFMDKKFSLSARKM